MSPTQRLNYMKKELRKVKKFLDLYTDCSFAQYNKGNAMWYYIVTKDKKLYVIADTTYDFPNINFKNIIYISKMLKTSFHNYDIYKGEFDIKTDYSYYQNLFNKMGIAQYIATGAEY